jgi:hypothetical protein
MRNVFLRRPSGAMVVAIIALVVAASGTAIAATKMVSGDKLIIKNSLSGNRLRRQTLTGAQIKPHSLTAAQLRAHTITATQINHKKLGKVDSAKNADHATAATTAIAAVNANNASNAAELSGQPASTFLTVANRIGTSGLVTSTASNAGVATTVFKTGPFTVTMSCTSSNGSGTSVQLFASSSESNSVIDGTNAGPANTQVELSEFDASTASGPPTGRNGLLDLEAPSGNVALLIGADDVASLNNTPCWADFAGIH